MTNIVIKKHNFDAAKNNIRQFSLTKPDQLALKKVDVDGGLFNWFDHKVTGAELNSLTNQIQDYLIKFNNLNSKFIKEFGEVYNALEALDKEYIQGILISVKAAEQASMEAKEAQKDINRTIEVQKQTLKVLENFKNKLDKLMHLENVDEVWNDTQRFSKELTSIKEQIQTINDNSKQQTSSITSLTKFKTDLSKQNHLNSIDSLWDDAQEAKLGIKSIEKKLSNCTTSIESQSKTISAIKSFMDKLNKLEHVLKIDELWNNMQVISKSFELLNKRIIQIESNVVDYSKQINSLNQFIESLKKLDHLFDIDEIWGNTQTLKGDIKQINGQIIQMNEKALAHEQYISSLTDFDESLKKHEHLHDVDQMWGDIDQSKSKMNLLQDEVTSLEQKLATMNEQMSEQKQNYENELQMLTKKSKNAMLLGGTSVGLVIILAVLNLVGIL